MMKFTKGAAITLSLIFFCVLPAGSVDWLGLNQATIAWNAVTTLSNGDPLPAGDTIRYRVYMANDALATGTGSKQEPSLLGETAELTYVITITAEGRYVVGVGTVRFNAAGDELAVSETINWSDVNGASTPNPFGFERVYLPAAVENLRSE